MNGPLGMRGASNAHDYCLNLTTTLHKIQADERISDQRSWINTAKALIVFSKISENISNVTGEKESNQLLILLISICNK